MFSTPKNPRVHSFIEFNQFLTIFKISDRRIGSAILNFVIWTPKFIFSNLRTPLIRRFKQIHQLKKKLKFCTDMLDEPCWILEFWPQITSTWRKVMFRNKRVCIFFFIFRTNALFQCEKSFKSLKFMSIHASVKDPYRFHKLCQSYDWHEIIVRNLQSGIDGRYSTMKCLIYESILQTLGVKWTDNMTWEPSN